MDVDSLLSGYNRDMLQIFDYERQVSSDAGNRIHLIGVDEAGRGPLAGPVVAAAVLYRGDTFDVSTGDVKDWKLVRDSKTLSPKQRERAFAFVHEQFSIGTGLSSPETIDRINILQATFLAMKEALTNLRLPTLNPRPQETRLVLVDGNQPIPHLSTPQQTVVDGDALATSIAAASIVAKVTRDRMMGEYDAAYPGYGFARHKGYGTREHMQALLRLGPTPVHRMSFAPVRDALVRFRELGIERDRR